ncbi:hypothetical protein DRN75_02100 [Nanoarchaeota archaeon]|nr:MAG: hypothetical protein DRN75_02100 [Nanoarchaeota archaeon]
MKLDYIVYGVVFAFFIFLISNATIESVWPDEAMYAWDSSHLLHESANIDLAKTNTYLTTIIAAPLAAVIDPLVAYRVVVAAFAALTLLFVYLLTKEISGEYTGIAAAIAVLSSSVFVFISSRALVDTPLAAMFTASIWSLYRLEKNRSLKNAVLFSILTGLTLLTKSIAVLLLIVYALYFIIAYKSKVFSLLREKNIQISVAVMIPFLAASVYNIVRNLSVLMSPVKGAIFIADKFYYFMHPITSFGWVVILLLPAIIVIRKNIKKKGVILLLSWAVVYILWFSFIVGEKVPRYVLPAVPAVASLSAMSVMLVPKNKRIIVVIAIALLALYGLKGGLDIIKAKSTSYIGLRDVGEYLSNVDHEIYAGSRRAIRLFSGKEYFEYGGNLKKLPESFDKFLEDTANKTVSLEIDVWEYTQPSWVYPLNQEKINNLMANGFNISYTANREINGQKVTVAAVFTKSS